MTQTSLKAFKTAVLIAFGMLSLPSPAEAGWGCGWGCGWGPGLFGLGVGAIVGSALVAPRVYAGPPPAYGPVAYGPRLVTRVVQLLRSDISQLQPTHGILHRARRPALLLSLGTGGSTRTSWRETCSDRWSQLSCQCWPLHPQSRTSTGLPKPNTARSLTKSRTARSGRWSEQIRILRSMRRERPRRLRLNAGGPNSSNEPVRRVRRAPRVALAMPDCVCTVGGSRSASGEQGGFGD